LDQFYPVSPTTARDYSNVVTYFILVLHKIFSFFYAVLIFCFFFIKKKEKQNVSIPVGQQASDEERNAKSVSYM
jgi:purine-cytosine permease-like protein